MSHVTLEIYDKEYSFLKSLEYSEDRLMSSDVESSSLISDFNKLFFDSFEPILKENRGKNKLFWEINNYCIDIIKIEYERTKDLNVSEFYVWHLSIFMTIQSFITITGSKYNLEHEKEIKRLLDKLLKKDLYKFIKLNSEKVGIGDISPKLRKILAVGDAHLVISQSKSKSFINIDLVKSSFKNDYKNYNNIKKEKYTERVYSEEFFNKMLMKE